MIVSANVRLRIRNDSVLAMVNSWGINYKKCFTKQHKYSCLHFNGEKGNTIRGINMIGFCFDENKPQNDLQCQNNFSHSTRFTWISLSLIVTQGTILTQ